MILKFQASKFVKYLDFYKSHTDVAFDTLVMIVNHNLQDEDIEISENSTVPFINPDIYFRGEE